MEKKIKTEEMLIEAKNFFNFYKKEIGKYIRGGKNVVFISFSDLSSFSHELAESLLSSPEEILQILDLALDELGIVNNPRVRLLDLPATHFIKIRDLRSKHLNTFITVEGIVRQASEVRPQVANARFECPSCGSVISVLQIEKTFREPTRCSCGRKGGFKLISKDMVDAQRIVVEESPEALEGGEQPRRISVFLKDDLVDPKMEERTTPGSRVRLMGVLKEVPVPSHTGAIQTRFDLAIEVNNILPLEETFESLEVNEEDERQIKELSEDSKIFEKLWQSIAPGVWGYDEIKQSLTLQLFGGVKKKRSEGTDTRGDMHIMLVGDPGVAKSHILKFMSTIAPKGRYLAGRGASGAGLTATVVRDEFLRGWALEAGAMVLSNKGMISIDEIEKMDEADRSAMHEALEQQTVTISKAGVQATLRAETTVLAAGNPKLGRFDPFQPIARQIDIQPTLLNRFDLIFIIRDLPDRAKDEAIATHVLMEHQKAEPRNVIEKELLRKYIAYSKQRIQPKLSDEAVDEIKRFYVGLRNAPGSSEGILRPIPITARQLEALIRLSEASAKTKLSKKVVKDDVKRAINLMKFYLMQVGYDSDTKAFDIDKIVTGVSTSQRSRIILVREALARLESRIGKLIPVQEIEKEMEGKLNKEDIDDALEKLSSSGDIFIPRKGCVQRV